MTTTQSLSGLYYSKELKKFGVDAKSELGYILIPANGCPVESIWRNEKYALIRTDIVMYGGNGKDKWPAYSDEQLKKVVPESKHPFYWEVWQEWCYRDFSGKPRGYESENAALCSCLIEMLERNLITADEVNKRLQQS